MVDLHEREYLRSQNVVSETQCDLGLTALKLDDVLKLMSDDYPEKCHVSDHDAKPGLIPSPLDSFLAIQSRMATETSRTSRHE